MCDYGHFGVVPLCRHFINAFLSTVRLGSRPLLVFLGSSDVHTAELEQNWCPRKSTFMTQTIHGAGIFTYIETP